MSRTYKDRPNRLKYPKDTDYITIARYRRIKTKTTKPKVRRTVDDSWHWYAVTPSWWTRMCMTRPQRRACRLWERKVLFEDIEETDIPFFGKKPHIYYY